MFLNVCTLDKENISGNAPYTPPMRWPNTFIVQEGDQSVGVGATLEDGQLLHQSLSDTTDRDSDLQSEMDGSQHEVEVNRIGKIYELLK